MAASILTAQRLRELLHYQPETGVFRWKERRGDKSWNSKFKGRIAGTRRHGGYIQISIDGRTYRAHRLAWLYIHGEWPQNQIDHMNGVRTDNRIQNLRDVLPVINSQNLRKPYATNTSGLLGVTQVRGSGRYRSQIRVHGRKVMLGTFDTAEAAHQAYLRAKMQYHAGSTL